MLTGGPKPGRDRIDLQPASLNPLPGPNTHTHTQIKDSNALVKQVGLKACINLPSTCIGVLVSPASATLSSNEECVCVSLQDVKLQEKARYR